MFVEFCLTLSNKKRTNPIRMTFGSVRYLLFVCSFVRCRLDQIGDQVPFFFGKHILNAIQDAFCRVRNRTWFALHNLIKGNVQDLAQRNQLFDRRFPMTAFDMSDMCRRDVQHLCKLLLRDLDIMPANRQLFGFERSMIENEDAPFLLNRFINCVRSRYDYILIDCSPSLGILTQNALVAADSVMIPVDPEFFGLEGVKVITDTMELVYSFDQI